MTRRIVGWALRAREYVFALLLLCGAAAHGAESVPRPAGNLEVWAWNIAAGSLEKLVPAFNQRYPDIHVNVNMTGANMIVRLMLSLSAGVGAPDVSQIEMINAPRYSLTGRLMDLTERAAPYAGKFVPASWGNCTLDGKLYAIPWDVGPCAVFYKRSVFARYGLDSSSVETWDDYIAMGRQLVERSGGKTKMLAFPTNNAAVMFEIMIQQNGGQVFDDQGRIAINSPQAHEALNAIQRMLDVGISANTPLWGQTFLASLNGDAVATYPMAAWFGGLLKESAPNSAGDWGIFRLPALTPGGLRTSTSGGSVLIIPEQCRNKDAAWAYVEYALCDKQTQIAQYRNFDLFPALLSAYDDPFFDEPDAFYGGQRVRRLFSQDVERIPVLNRTKDWREAMGYITQALSHWASNECADTDRMLADLARNLGQRLRRDLAPAQAGPTP